MSREAPRRQWLSPDAYRALTPAERRALFEARRAGASERAYERALRQHERRFRPPGARYRKGFLKREAKVWAMALAFSIALALAGQTVRWSTQRVVSAATATAPARASFASCKWGGGTDCVVDGDTFYWNGDKIRIAGIDAPETHDYDCPEELALGERAAERLQVLLNGGAVSLSSIDRDRDIYGRLLRNASVDGVDVGDMLVSEGLARPYADGRRSWC